MHASRSQHKKIIGIMADSHGQAARIRDALLFFDEQGCDRIYHLGDICDSAHPENAESCVHLLRQRHVHAIKGNNDHQVVVNHVGGPNTDVSMATIEFLQQLPLTIEVENLVLAHSLPFVKDRGLSSMIGSLGEHEVALFFRLYPNKILMRGHSHLPALIQSPNKNIVGREFAPGVRQQLSDVVPGIVTCGAVDHGYVMIWDRLAQTLCSYKLR